MLSFCILKSKLYILFLTYCSFCTDVVVAVGVTHNNNPRSVHRPAAVWHPNVSSVTGAICLDILKDQWSPALTMKTALLSLQALMCSPEPNDPQDAVVANMYKERHEEFVATARFWTETHAKPTSGLPAPEVSRWSESSDSSVHVCMYVALCVWLYHFRCIHICLKML
jgi:hypothetical protein